MPAQIEVIDSFRWCGGQGRFSPGALGNGGNEAAEYRVGGLFGDLAFSMLFAFKWNGLARPLCHLWSPPFQPFPSGGCDAAAEPPKQCLETLTQLDFGTLTIDAAGGLYYAGNSYVGGDGDYTPLPFAVSSSSGPKAIAGAWNVIELKMEMAGVVLAGGGSGCGAIDLNPGAYGLLAARMNGSEIIRFRARDGDIDKVHTTTCACFLCEHIPLGVGRVQLFAEIYAARTLTDDFLFRSWDMTEGEDPWIGDGTAMFLPAAGVGSSAQWVPVGAATNWQAAASDDGAISYNETDEASKRDALALEVSADTRPVIAAQPLVVAKAGYKAGGGPPTKAFYRRAGLDYPTGNLFLPTTFEAVTESAGVPVAGETPASLSAGEIGYTTE